MYIVLAILVFGLLIATHELGHFVAAKLCGVRVLEFSIGMGPALFKKQGKETKYALRLLPIGGFCSMEGEDSDSEDPAAFTNQKPWRRAVILAAGAAMNFVTGLILIIALFSQADGFNIPLITGFMDGCPYESSEGLQAGDTIYSINGHRIYFSSNVATYADGDTSDIVVIRDGEKVYLNDYRFVPVEYQKDGETVKMYGLYFSSYKGGALSTLKYSWYCAVDFVRLVWMSLEQLVTGAVGLKDLSGPVGIVGLMNNAGQSAASVGDALYMITYLAAFIAINLAVMNLLPIPALDGGRLFFLLITFIAEKLVRHRIDPKYEGYVHMAGFALLMALMLFIMVNDITKIVTG